MKLNDQSTQPERAATQSRPAAAPSSQHHAECERVVQQVEVPESLPDRMHNSPRMVAQRRQLRSLFGMALQMKSAPSPLPKSAVIQRVAKISELSNSWSKSSPVITADLGDTWHASVFRMAAPNSIFYDGFHITGPKVGNHAPHFFYSPQGAYDQAASETHWQTIAWRRVHLPFDWTTALSTANTKVATAVGILAAELTSAQQQQALLDEQQRRHGIQVAENAQAAAAQAAAAQTSVGNSLKEWLITRGKSPGESSYYRGVQNWRGDSKELAEYQAWCEANQKAVIP